MILVLFCSLVLLGCSSRPVRWTNKDICDSASVEIIYYGTNGDAVPQTFHFSDEDVDDICTTFSNLAVKKVKIRDTLIGSYCVRFLDDSGKEIESVVILGNYNAIDNNGQLYEITDEINIYQYVNAIVSSKAKES